MQNKLENITRLQKILTRGTKSKAKRKGVSFSVEKEEWTLTIQFINIIHH